MQCDQYQSAGAEISSVNVHSSLLFWSGPDAHTKKGWELSVGMRLVIQILMLMPLGRSEFRHVSSIVAPKPSLLCFNIFGILKLLIFQYHLYRQWRSAVQAWKERLFKCIQFLRHSSYIFPFLVSRNIALPPSLLVKADGKTVCSIPNQHEWDGKYSSKLRKWFASWIWPWAKWIHT